WMLRRQRSSPPAQISLLALQRAHVRCRRSPADFSLSVRLPLSPLARSLSPAQTLWQSRRSETSFPFPALPSQWKTALSSRTQRPPFAQQQATSPSPASQRVRTASARATRCRSRTDSFAQDTPFHPR